VRLGFLTAPLPDTPLMEVADWAAANEFDSLEIAVWPHTGGTARRYAGRRTSTSPTRRRRKRAISWADRSEPEDLGLGFL
jgi:hypothetical protein